MASEHARHWVLDPDVDFLNHGSFGATPRPVLDDQAAWRERLEREPVRFMVDTYQPALDEARSVLADFLGADANDLAFVTNATGGCNTVLRSLELGPGEELLTTDHAYNAVRNAMAYVAERAGARVVTVELPFPLPEGPEAVLERVLAAVTPRTRLAVIDHVTSATAMVLPVQRLVAALEEQGVDTLVDGAHAPGMLPLDVAAIGAAYYTGNLHKWVCAPKGAGFLLVRRDRQPGIHPLVISHGANLPLDGRTRFRREFDWQGTADPSAWLAVPAALRFVGELLPGGWTALQARNHALALEARDLLCGVVGEPPPVPDEMIGSMASVPLAWEREPASVQGVNLAGDRVHAALLAAGIQVMVTPWPQRPEGQRWRRLVRVSAAAYNDRAQMERLATVLGAALNATV